MLPGCPQVRAKFPFNLALLRGGIVSVVDERNRTKGQHAVLKERLQVAPLVRATAGTSRSDVGVDNLTNRDYYETQNYFESRVMPDAPIVARIHGTPGYPLTAVVGLTFRLGGK